MIRPAVAVILMSPWLAAAQTTQLSGLILDTSGGAVRGAAIALVNQENGVRRTTQSNAEGVYVIPAVRPGPYKITVRKEGFRSFARTGLDLEVGQAARVDFTLQVGNVEEVITVEGTPAWAASETAMLGLLVPRAFVDGLPVNGRSLLGLLDLTPGVVITPVRDSNEAGQFIVNGQRPNANLINIDGVSANFGMQEETPGHALSGGLPALSPIGSLHSIVQLASVDELRLSTSNSAAEAGRFSGGQLALSTRAGGASWHGSVQHYLRNEKLDANDWFANQSGAKRPPLRWNQAGAWAGGPLVRERTFLVGSYEGFRLRQPQQVFVLVPSEQQRRQPGKLARSIVPFFPRANWGLPVPPGFGVFAGGASRGARLDAAGLRLDHTLSGRLSMFARVYAAPGFSTKGSVGSLQAIGFSMTDASYTPVQATAGVGATLGPSTYLDLRFNHSFLRIGQWGRTVRLEGVEPWDPYLFLPRQAGGQPLQWRSVRFGQWSPLEQWNGRVNRQSQWQAVPSLSLVRGGHQARFGSDYRMLRPTLRDPGLTATADFPDADSIEAPAIITLERRVPIGLRFHNLSVWGADTWKLHPRLTVSFGLRWEWNPAPTASDARPTYIVSALAEGGAPRLEASGGPLWRSPARNLAPRLSLAWQVSPNGAVMVRAGTGVHYNLGSGAVLSSLQRQPGYFNSAIFVGTPGALTGIEPPALDSSLLKHAGLTGALPDLRMSASLQSTVTLDLASARAGALSAGWVSTLGRRLLRSEFTPLTAAPYLYLELTTNHGSSNYHALQAQYRSPVWSRMRALVAYTWSHAIDNGSLDAEVRLAEARRLDRGSADFDVRHSLTAAFLLELPSRRRVWGNWNVDGVLRARTGFPFSPHVSGWPPDPARPYAFLEPPVYRPDLDRGRSVWLFGGGFPGGRAIDPAAFPVPSQARMGTLGRNAIPGFPFRQIDLSVHRKFAFGSSRARFELRADAFNALNTPNFSLGRFGLNQGLMPPYVTAPVLVNQELSTAGVGGSPASGLTPVFQMGGPRSIQLSARIEF